MVFILIIYNLCQTFPIKRLQNPKMFTGWVHFVFFLYNSVKQYHCLHPDIQFHFKADHTQGFVDLCLENDLPALAKLNACLEHLQGLTSFS